MTELEAVVLGVIWLRGPLTAYAVKRELDASPGAIYPLLERLERERLIRSLEQGWGQRGKKEYSILAAGVDALRGGTGEIDRVLDELNARRAWLTRISRALRNGPRAKARKK